MDATFYITALVAVASTFLAVSRANALHALLYLVLSLLAVAMMFYLLGAPFAAMLEVIVYAGSVVVLFVFVVMMLNLGSGEVEHERRMLTARAWIGPAVLSVILSVELLYLFFLQPPVGTTGGVVTDATQVGQVLFGPYILAVELASMLLLAGLVGAYHLGRRQAEER